MEESPVGFGAEGNIAKLINLKEGERKREKGGREELKGKIDCGHGEKKNIGK